MRSIVVPKFVPEAERLRLRARAQKYFEDGVLQNNPAGPKRYFLRLDDTEYCDAGIAPVVRRIITQLELKACPVDPYLGWMISYIQPGGFIHPHFDAYPHYVETGDRHLRCNLMVSKHGPSGNPIIDGMNFQVDEGDMWAFFASECEHGTGVVAGTAPRIVYQFGFVVPPYYTFIGKLPRSDHQQGAA